MSKHKVLGIIVGFLLTAAIAYAAFTAIVTFGGSNGGAGKTTGGPINVTSAGSPTGSEIATAVSPGQMGTLYIKVSNGSGSTLALQSWTPTGPVIISTSDGTCDGPASFTTPTVNSLSIPVPQGTSIVAIPNAVGLNANPQPGCSNAMFKVDGNAAFGF